MTSEERPIVPQQQIFPDRGRNVQHTDSCVTSGPEVLPQSAAAEMLQRARPGPALTQHLDERLVLLRGRRGGGADNQYWRNCSFDQERRGSDD